MTEAACGKGIACTVYFNLSGISIDPNHTPCHGCNLNCGIETDIAFRRVQTAEGVTSTQSIGIIVHCLGYLPGLCDSQYFTSQYRTSQTAQRLS